MGKSIIGTFSYPLNQEENVRKAAKLAELEGKSLSSLVVRLLEEYVQKNGVRVKEEFANPLQIPYAQASIKAVDKILSSLTTLDEFIADDTALAVLTSEDMARIEGRAASIHQKTRLKYMELRKREMFSR